MALIFDLLYDHIDFKTMMKLRVTGKSICEIYNNEHYWKIINLTDTSTQNNEYLIELFENSKDVYLYNLSNKNKNILSFPVSIWKNLNKTKLLIF